MQFLYHKQSGQKVIDLKNEDFKYIVKARRHREDDTIALRDFQNPDTIYFYTLQKIAPKSATLILKEQKELIVKAKKDIYIAWCIIDTNSIEKVLPMLNEIGIAGITFIYCDRSQFSTKLKLDRFQRILQSSSMQCGRGDYIKIEVADSIYEYLKRNPDTIIVDFSKNNLDKHTDKNSFLIGPEGGFSSNEREFFKKNGMDIAGFDTDMILRSESAVVCVASKILL